MQGLEFPSAIEYNSFVCKFWPFLYHTFWKSNKSVVFATRCNFLLNGILIVKFKKTVLPLIWYEKKIYLCFLITIKLFSMLHNFCEFSEKQNSDERLSKHITVNSLPFHWNNFTKLTFIWLSLVNGETFSV